MSARNCHTRQTLREQVLQSNRIAAFVGSTRSVRMERWPNHVGHVTARPLVGAPVLLLLLPLIVRCAESLRQGCCFWLCCCCLWYSKALPGFVPLELKVPWLHEMGRRDAVRVKPKQATCGRVEGGLVQHSLVVVLWQRRQSNAAVIRGPRSCRCDGTGAGILFQPHEEEKHRL